MKKTISNEELLDKLLSGSEKLSNIVGSTLGPKGKNVILKQKTGNPIITKDGVTVSRFFSLEDPFENLGASVIKQAAESSVHQAGDGTTTATVLANAFFKESLKVLKQKNISVYELQRQLKEATQLVLKSLKVKTKDISSLDEIEQVAFISSNGDKSVSSMIKMAVDKIGQDGSITIQESRSSETILDVSEGFTFESGLMANAFITDEKREILRYEDCLVLVTNKSINTIDELMPILEIVARDGRPLAIIAEQVENVVLTACVANALRGTMKICVIKAPKYGEERKTILEDIALITGASFVNRESGVNFRSLKLSNLGTIKILESSKFMTTIVSSGSSAEEVANKINILKQQISEIDNIKECAKIQERINRLAGGIAIIKVGGSTEIEMKELKDRLEDALEAVSSAQAEGILPGGGSQLLKTAHEVYVDNEVNIGFDVFLASISAAFRKMCDNAGYDASELESLIANSDENFGINILTGELVNMYDAGIIDPFKVVRCALENAVSAATTLLTTNAAIVEE